MQFFAGTHYCHNLEESTVLLCFSAHALISKHVPLLKHRCLEINCIMFVHQHFQSFLKMLLVFGVGG